MIHKRTSALFLGLLLSSLPLLAQPFRIPEAQDAVPGELIVLLASGHAGNGAPTPEAVVENHRRGLKLSIAAGAARPLDVKTALAHRAQGRIREEIEADPDSPRARLERYLLLKFPANADLDSIQAALERDPHVLHVERNSFFKLHVSPSDPLFPVAGTPADHQWGSHLLNLGSAWDYAKGHAYIGLIDTGLQVTHPDLRPFSSTGTWLGGNFRPHLSWDFASPASCSTNQENCVDELESGFFAGHGTHVAGIVAANTNNAAGVSGACWNCSILMTRGARIDASQQSLASAANGITWLTDHGVQAISMSFGDALSCDPPSANIGFFCDALDFADDRDVLMTASAGNDKTDIDFPASDPRVLSIGGIESSGGFWDRADEGEGCPCNWSNRPGWLITACNENLQTFECGSNYTVTPGSAQQDLVAPARQVLSTFYENREWNLALGCHDTTVNGVNHAGVGYDVCTGTSMSSPYVAAIAGILRSVNPLLGKDQIAAALTSHASHSGSRDPKLGYGYPNASASVQAILGRANGVTLANRLTPLFVLYSPAAGDHLYTTFPQVGSAAMFSTDYSPFKSNFTGLWPDVSGYDYFPGAGCPVGPCSPEPGASVYIFSTDRSPNGSPLVPLFRMSYEDPNSANRDMTYTTEKAGIELLRGSGYRLDGTEGYIYKRCTPEPSCIPAGAVRLYRRYNASRDDYAIFPESELAAMVADGYTQALGNDWIGYVYPNLDGDFDNVIDGFEGLIGTNPALGDSDCDGLADGAEILGYPNTDPRIANSGTGCPIFADVPANHWARSFIETIYHEGVTAGCATNPLRYCPDAQVGRASMAIFLLRAKFGSTYQPPPATCSPLRFADVPCNHWAAAWIEELADQGVTTGCGSGNYCPDGLVDRSQMAIFLLRTLEGPNYQPPPVDCNAPRFSDVQCNHWAAAWIEELARRGITAGCNTTSTYCPADIVNRASMAVFLVRTFNF
jgi:serine protease